MPLLRLVLVTLSFTLGTAPAGPAEDLRALLDIGPREAGSLGNARARAYLAEQFARLGYDVREEPFSYTRFQDLGSRVRAGAAAFDARALQGSARATVTAPVAFVAGVGTPAQFQAADVRGKVAVVARGGMLFRDKARNALAAGASALIIVNSENRVYRGAIGDAVGLPVLSVASSARNALRTARRVTLDVNVERGVVRGANVVASRSDAAPTVVFGAHHDSMIRSPGLNDNASGVAAVLDVARTARNTPLARRAWFVLFDGEEDRFQGSSAFVRTHAKRLPDMRAMLNLDMVGVAAEPLAVGGSANLVRLARSVLPTLGTFDDDGLSDHETFMRAGVPGLFFFRGIDANYHEPSDTVARPELVVEAARAALAVARRLLGLPAP